MLSNTQAAALKRHFPASMTAGLPQDLPSLVKIEWQGPLPQLALTPQQAVPSNVPAPATGSAAMAAAQPAAEDLGTVIDRRSVASPAAGKHPVCGCALHLLSI